MTQNIVFDYSKLKGRIVEKYGSQKNFYKALGWNNSSLAMKLAGKTKFTIYEIPMLCEMLEIPIEQLGVYFFTQSTKEV